MPKKTKPKRKGVKRGPDPEHLVIREDPKGALARLLKTRTGKERA